MQSSRQQNQPVSVVAALFGLSDGYLPYLRQAWDLIYMGQPSEALTVLARVEAMNAFKTAIRTTVAGPYGIATALGRVHFMTEFPRITLPRGEYWLGGTMLWLAIGVALLVGLSCRHTEPQP